MTGVNTPVFTVLGGTVPEAVLGVALSAPFRVHVPLAPGEALLLAHGRFWDARREEVSLCVRACACVCVCV